MAPKTPKAPVAHVELSHDEEPRVETVVHSYTPEQADRLRCKRNGTNYREHDGRITSPDQIDDDGNVVAKKKK